MSPPRTHNNDIGALTSLRYFAALWVLLFHWTNYFLDSPLENNLAVRMGFLGVDFFFVLSGFILTHVYLDRQRAGRLDYWSFISKRIARIYPMHILTLVMMIMLAVAVRAADIQIAGPWQPDEIFSIGKGEFPRELMANLLLIHAWGASDGLHFNMPSWSISAEWFAYLVFPILTAILAISDRRPAFTACASVLITLIFAYAMILVADRQIFAMSWNIGVLRIVPDFVMGIVFYRVSRFVSLGKLAAPLFYVCLALVALLAQFAAPLQWIVIVFPAIIFLAADAERNGALGWLKRPFPVLLGEISYSLYMLHFGFGMVFFGYVLAPYQIDSAPGIVSALAAGIAIVSLLSWLAYRWFEVPARRWLNGLADATMGGKAGATG